MGDKFEKLTYMTALFESNLRIFKTSWLIEKRDYEVSQLEKAYENCTNKRDRHNVRQRIKEVESEHFKSLRRAEKYNSEVLELIQGTNESQAVESVIDKSIDLYVDFTNLIFENTKDLSKDNPKNLVACLLIEDENGQITDELGKRYSAKFLTDKQ